MVAPIPNSLLAVFSEVCSLVSQILMMQPFSAVVAVALFGLVLSLIIKWFRFR